MTSLPCRLLSCLLRPLSFAVLAALALTPRASLQAAAPSAYQPPASPRATYNFNPGWKFIRQDVPGADQVAYNDAEWSTISTPHTWNDVDTYRAFISHGSGDRGGAYKGIGWYRKHFKLPADADGQKIFLEFEGLKQAARFFVNGQLVGKSENGVSACGIDLTKFVRYGGQDNVLAVKVDNSSNYAEEATGAGFQWTGNAFNPNFGGLNRNVWLHVMGSVYQTLPLYDNLKTTGVYVYAKNHDVKAKTAAVNIEAQVRNDSAGGAALTLAAVVVDADGVVRAKFDGAAQSLASGQTTTLTASGSLTSARFWETNDPYLYDVYSILSVNGKVADVCKIHTGFRKAEYKGGAGTGGVWLNDKFVWLTGYAQRAVNDWAGLGQAYPDWMHDYDAALLRSSNGNYVRWMHISPQAVDVRACDKYGIVQACPAGDKEGDSQGRQWAQRVEAMRNSMIYFRNSPSILMWEAGNSGVSTPHLQEMLALRRQWDPNGGRVMGCRTLNDPGATPIAEYFGVMVGQAPQTDSLNGPNAMFRAYSAVRRDRAPLIETEDFRDEGPRGIWDDNSPPHFGFKKGADDTYNWNSETFAIAAVRRYSEYFINRIDNRDPAHSKWSGYASIYWADSDADGRQQSSEVLRVSGKVDSVRLPKEIYYASRVMQGDRPDLHIIGHWTYPAGTKKTMTVVAAGCDTVELFLNGQSLGRNTSVRSNFLYAFPNVTFAPGTLKAVGTKAGKIVAQQELETAGDPKALKLTVHTGPQGLQADGSDVVLIDFEVVDAQGRRCPTDEARVDFAVTGPAIWRGGLNSAIPKSTNNLYLNTECGINRVSVRSTLTAGAITVTATRTGLTPATVKITSVPVAITDGLSRAMPQTLPGLAATAP